MSEPTLVLGIGNILLGDEGCGVRAMEYLRARFPELPGVAYLDGGTLSFTLAPAIERVSRLIVLDAAQLQAEPGTVRCFEGADMDRFLGQVKRTVHEVGLLDLLDIARLCERLPPRRALVGIQARQISWSDTLSPPVAAALPVAAEYVLALLEKWQ
jgi:hydrogenase maturation protease